MRLGLRVRVRVRVGVRVRVRGPAEMLLNIPSLSVRDRYKVKG